MVPPDGQGESPPNKHAGLLSGHRGGVLRAWHGAWHPASTCQGAAGVTKAPLFSGETEAKGHVCVWWRVPSPNHTAEHSGGGPLPRPCRAGSARLLPPRGERLRRAGPAGRRAGPEGPEGGAGGRPAAHKGGRAARTAGDSARTAKAHPAEPSRTQSQPKQNPAALAPLGRRPALQPLRPMKLAAMIKKMRPSRPELSVPARNCSRLVVLGSSQVGKTAIVSRFLTGRFEDAYTPTVEDFHRKFYSIRGELYQLDILDTAGRHPFPAMRRLSILTGDVFILVFSLDSRESFEEAQRLRQQILDTKSCLQSKPGGRPDVPLVLCGNKGDRSLHREVEPAEVLRLLGAGPPRCAYFEVSARSNSSLEPMFRALFALAGLPGEMSPGLHRRLSAQHGEALPQALRARKQLCAGGPAGALGIVAPFARRPSVHSDLLCVREKAGGPAKDRERCVIS